MFLQSLTLRGFKSFADKTQLEFEPGITVIVGPNGSGKSNVVDALTWALGTHSAKSLRGGSMADVIFAGAPGRPGLGRAAVDLTIDNADGALPIEFSEVTVSRAMFASGENDYAINGIDCRALDVAELLSDTGLGRENHTIVGQGQLDAVLNAKPEDRRAFIEEAAGILKHRRRKERAVRKLAQMEGHVERLADVLRELRRNLRPLERQAEAAAKHAELQAVLRAVRYARALREYAVLADRWSADSGAREGSDALLAGMQGEVEASRAAEAATEAALAELGPTARRATETHFRLANLVERYRGLTDRIEERRRGLLEAVEEPVAGRDPAELREQAAGERTRSAGLSEELSVARRDLGRAEDRRREAERARRAHEQAAAAEARRRSEARERLLRWEGEVSALRSSLSQAAGEEGRLASQLSGMRARKTELEADRRSLRQDIERLDAAQAQLAQQLAAAEDASQRRADIAADVARHERELERRRASLEARAEALRAASEEGTEGAAHLLAAADAEQIDGVLGRLADRVGVVDGMAKAAAAALGPLCDAVVVASRTSAEQAVGWTRSQRAGRVQLLPARPAAPDARHSRQAEFASLGARPVVDALRADPEVLAALAWALADVYVVDDFDAACRLAQRYHDAVFVTAAGEVAGARGYAGGSAGSPSAVLSRAAAEQAETQLAVVADDLLRAHRRVADTDRDVEGARRELDAATAAMQESDGLITAAAERLNRAGKELATCERELAMLTRQAADLEREVAGQRARLTTLETRGVDDVPPESGVDGDGPDLEAERLEDALAEAREAEVQARLAASAADQRRAEHARRVEALEREAVEVERRLRERALRRERRLEAIERCDALAVVAAAGLDRAEQSLALAEEERERVEEARASRQRELGAVRAQVRTAEEHLTALTETRHREELARQELRMALDATGQRLRDEFAVDPTAALTQAREDADVDGAAVGVDGAAGDVLGGGDARDAALLEEEERLVRKVGLLGAINPLALEEFKALQERHRFLSEQLDDLRASRRDLEQVVAAVDDRIREVFAAAFADVAAQFERIFPRLFPGGEGRLVLTEPADLLGSGVEVEARPPGKRVKRLSLLSGGERSLTALAVLFAIFAARPSPFYVLDEVEAALDDVNLQRFLDIVVDFKASSQVIIVTHQKRTMEIADLLYGVTMQGNGVSKVISQRLSGPEPVAVG